MLYSVNLIAILAPILIVQYGLSLFCLLKLVFLDQPLKKFIIWNVFILLAVGVGVATFLVCYFGFRDKVFPQKAKEAKEEEKEKAKEEVKEEEQSPQSPDGDSSTC